MADPSAHGDEGGGIQGGTAGGPDRESPPGMPRWVKVSGILVGALILLLLILALTGVLGGQHGPGRHLPGGDTGPGVTGPGAHTPPVQHDP